MDRSVSKLGFTSIELVIVIVLLGILSVIAAPRFVSLSSEASSSLVKQLAANIKMVTESVQMKAATDGYSLSLVDENPSGFKIARPVVVDIDGVSITTYLGIPVARWKNRDRSDALSAMFIGEFKQVSASTAENTPCDADLCIVDNLPRQNILGPRPQFPRGGDGYFIYPKGYKLNNMPGEQCFAYFAPVGRMWNKGYDGNYETGFVDTGCK